MRIFVSEHLSSGACPEIPLEHSLMREGFAMVAALIEDFESLPNVAVSTTIDARFAHDSVRVSGDIRLVATAEQEHLCFDELAREADAVLIIAPETDRLLEQRVRQVLERHPSVRSLNCDGEAIALCGDKRKLPEQLEPGGLSAIPSATPDFAATGKLPFEFPIVIKPRFGAGCEKTYGIESAVRWSRFRQSFLSRNPSAEAQSWIVQPLIRGVALSSAALFREDGLLLAALPPGRQNIERRGASLYYRGGTIPWQSSDFESVARQSEAVFRALAERLPGLNGYVGIDWIWNEEDRRLHLVEINPRLTTAYLGYRRLFGNQIAAAWLDGKTPWGTCPDELIRFGVDGLIPQSVSKISAEHLESMPPGGFVR
jgi:tyramine---L-glutamate ligase